MNLKNRAKTLKSDLPAVFLSLKDKDTPMISKLFAGITIVYALSPIDLIPDFIPVLGYLDDVILLPMFIAITIHFIPKEVWERNKRKSQQLWKNGKPKKWYYAIPILIIWSILIYLIVNGIQ